MIGEQTLQLGSLRITFHRTCRVPSQQGRTSALPASLGHFPIFRVSDFKGNVPSDWKENGHFIPIHSHEAMWIGFNRPIDPVALLVGAGMVNALTGERLQAQLSALPQNYLVVPPQPWIDGFKPTTGTRVFQFVASQLGQGETAEEQLLGSAEFGGIQLGLYHPQISLIPASRPKEFIESGGDFQTLTMGSPVLRSMRVRGGPVRTSGTTARSAGLGAGGAIEQRIYPDPYLQGRSPETVWGTEPVDRAFIHLVLAEDFKLITGRAAAPSPITYQTYQEQNLPWFALPDGSWGDIPGGAPIDTLKEVSGSPSAVNAGPQVNQTTKNIW